MTREDVMNSISLKKRFCKDCNLPITVFDNPYFEQRLVILDGLFGCIKKFERFCSGLVNFENEIDYFEYYNATKDSMINFIKSSDEFRPFIGFYFPTMMVDKYCEIVRRFPKRNLYVSDNSNRTLLSIDMRQANFSVMKYFAERLFGKANTWEEFVAQFTSCEHIIYSKYIRQVVLGACNPKQQTTLEKYLMVSLLDRLLPVIDEDMVYSLGTDEILVLLPYSEAKSSEILSKIREILNSNSIGKMVRCDVFRLEQLADICWAKHYIENGVESRIEFKCLDADIFHQIVKHYNNQPITEDDLVFYYNGRLARFLTEVDNPWKQESGCQKP